LKILVTGSSGLIGSAVCTALRNSGFDPLTMDLRTPYTGEAPAFRDITDVSESSRALRGVEGVIHLAAVSRVIDAQNNPERCLHVNVAAFENLMKMIVERPHPPWIIYGSSREVYGEPRYLPVDENHPLDPINVYGESKVKAEGILTHNKGSINSLIFRFSNVYGSKHDHPTRVVPAFLSGALEGKPLRIDSLDHVFDFTHVRDVAEALTVGVKKLSNGEIEGSDTLNISPGVGTSLSELVELIRGVTGTEITTIAGDKRSYDVARYIGNVEKLEARLGYRCRTQLKEGLSLMYEEYIDGRAQE
jgi:nucleoside-diphosphate-sugar epimerase